MDGKNLVKFVSNLATRCPVVLVAVIIVKMHFRSN